MDETIFKEKPHEFKKKILALNPKLKQDEREQPCETCTKKLFLIQRLEKLHLLVEFK